jgi:hypothetical protein
MSREVTRALEELAEHIDRHGLPERLRAVALILTTPDPPEWAAPLDAGRAVVVIGPTAADDAPAIVAALVAGEEPELDVLVLDLRATATAAALELVSGGTREVCVLGGRGDGKSVLGVIAWLLYAARHQAHGGTWPVRVLVPTTAMTEHRDKLCLTLAEPLFRGLLRPVDDEHVWIATLGGVEVLHLILFGVKDPTEQDKLRQAANAIWVEEAAPAAVEQTGGLDEAALGLGITSLRLPSYHHPVLVTSNYGSESHWSWTRYAVRQQPGTRLFRIPGGERATAEQRKAWMETLDGRPDLQRRLVLGEPALIVAGQGVLEGVWNSDVHVSREPLLPIRGARTVLGHDFGLRPCSVVIQEHRGQLRVLASLCTEYGGTAQHIPGVVLAWLGKVMPWLLGGGAILEHVIDPADAVGDQGDSTSSPERQLRKWIGGRVKLGPTRWPPRIEPLLGALGRLVGGRPVLMVAPGPDTAILREARRGSRKRTRRCTARRAPRASGTLIRGSCTDGARGRGGGPPALAGAARGRGAPGRHRGGPDAPSEQSAASPAPRWTRGKGGRSAGRARDAEYRGRAHVSGSAGRGPAGARGHARAAARAGAPGLDGGRAL